MISRRALSLALLAPLLAVLPPAGPAPAEAKSPHPQPFMGWSSWSIGSAKAPGYGTDWLTEANIKKTADTMAAKLKPAGYRYINLDAGWSATMDWQFHSDEYGIPSADPGRFPSGIKGVADYVHRKGLKLGIYGAIGLEKKIYDRNVPVKGTSCTVQDITVQPLTHANKWDDNWMIDYTKPCAQAYIDSIVAKYVSWDIDFLKIDGILASSVPEIRAYSKAIDKTGRKIWLSGSAWPVDIAAADGLRPWLNGVRIDTDVECYCETTATWESSVDNRWEDLPNWLQHLRPDYLADLDSMPINNNSGAGLQDGINDVERQSVMTFWSMASAPLYVGGDLQHIDQQAVDILTNPELIALDQSAVLPTRVTGGDLQVWKKVVHGKTYAAVYNLGSTPADITVDFKALGTGRFQRVRDLVARKDLGRSWSSWTAEDVPAHGSRLIRIG
ncbi:glycoside hydrolase family 27 protein [Kribbella sp. ALI-6-A]|uniref:glycoside hydrolase family 27 protein n=1 Tax=Kribbella sp. ALI-6-A TaxID=1933817 RepID=UPI0009FB9D40|nr:glycoside hydrolase family 27 protein [Kribbella sp. ALI-6-A]